MHYPVRQGGNFRPQHNAAACCAFVRTGCDIGPAQLHAVPEVGGEWLAFVTVF